MRSYRGGFFGILVPLVFLATSAIAQDSASAQHAAAPSNPSRDLLMSKCYQCHTDSIWRDQRQDARAWEATLYRMLGRGAVWSGDEIKTMTSFLATDFGPNSPKAAPPAR